MIPSTNTTTRTHLLQFLTCVLVAVLSTTTTFVRHNPPPLDRNQNLAVNISTTCPEAGARGGVRVANYIVRFREYRLAEEHLNYLRENVKGGGWEWVERRNPAARYPTDFGLVAIRDDVAGEGLVEEIGGLEMVKDVTVDKKVEKELLMEEQEKVGKRFTSMSFEAGDGDGGGGENFTAHFGRRLNMQVRD